MTDAFVDLDAYFAIDTGKRGIITSAQLSRYMRSQNYREAFVTKWLRLFDPSGTGLITLEQYCSALGLEAGKVRADRAAAKTKAPPALDLSTVDLPDDVTAISTDMGLEMQLRIVRFVREALRVQLHEKDIAKHLKQQCDSQLGRMWHALVMAGQFWCWYSHEPGYSFIFRLGKHVYCVWRSPGY